jgi:hypothetical protein
LLVRLTNHQKCTSKLLEKCIREHLLFWSKNRLQKITDLAGSSRAGANGWSNLASAASTAQYAYDGIGNLTADPYKGMTVTYDYYLDLPTWIYLPNNKSIRIAYDATGKKLRKTLLDNGNIVYRQDYPRSHRVIVTH